MATTSTRSCAFAGAANICIRTATGLALAFARCRTRRTAVGCTFGLVGIARTLCRTSVAAMAAARTFAIYIAIEVSIRATISLARGAAIHVASGGSDRALSFALCIKRSGTTNRRTTRLTRKSSIDIAGGARIHIDVAAGREA